MNNGIFTVTPPTGARTVKDTTSNSRRRPRWVSISRRPGRRLGAANQSRPRSMDSTRFMVATIPGEAQPPAIRNLTQTPGQPTTSAALQLLSLRLKP